MRFETVGLSPGRFATSTFVIVAQLGFDDANVTLRETPEAGVTMPLTKAPVGLLSARRTYDLSKKLEAYFFPQHLAEFDSLLSELHRIRHWHSILRHQFSEMSSHKRQSQTSLMLTA